MCFFRLGSRCFASSASANTYVAERLASYFPMGRPGVSQSDWSTQWPGNAALIPATSDDAVEWVLPLLRRTAQGFAMAARVQRGEGHIYVQYARGASLGGARARMYERGESQLFFVAAGSNTAVARRQCNEAADESAVISVASCLYPRIYWIHGHGGGGVDFSRSFTPQAFREMAREFLLCVNRMDLASALPINKILYHAAQAAAASERKPFRTIVCAAPPPQPPPRRMERRRQELHLQLAKVDTASVAELRIWLRSAYLPVSGTLSRLRERLRKHYTSRIAACAAPPPPAPPEARGRQQKKERQPATVTRKQRVVDAARKAKEKGKRAAARAEKAEKDRNEVQMTNRLITEFAA